MPSRVWWICNRYESGYGHGLKSDGLDLSKTPHVDPELGEAYQIGYEAGKAEREKKQERQSPFLCNEHGGFGFRSDCYVCQPQTATERDESENW